MGEVDDRACEDDRNAGSPQGESLQTPFILRTTRGALSCAVVTRYPARIFRLPLHPTLRLRGCPIPIGSARDQGDFNCVEDTETDTKKKS
eukprot:scaffold191385_cov31-Tisochrysis_lutea.AAC.1